MSYYYKYDFVSPEGVYATVKEELKSYFDTGAVDDLLFPTYLNKCLQKLGKATYSIAQDIITLDDFEARLPDNFYAVREAWLCTEVGLTPYQSANSFYSQTASATIQIAPMTVNGASCGNPECTDSRCVCQPEVLSAVYKTNHQMTRSYKREYLLKPGNISVQKNCDMMYIDDPSAYGGTNSGHHLSTSSSSYDSFDIRDNKFVTNFRNGTVNLVFYATDYDNNNNQLIPDNHYIKEYIEAFIKAKVFEMLANQTNDETFNQLQQKAANYKMLSDEGLIMARTEMRRQTAHQKQRSIIRGLKRLNKYELPGTVRRIRRRWRYD